MLPSDKKLAIVVVVESGIPVSVEAFTNLDQALVYEKKLRSQLRPDYDEVGVFELSLSDLSREIS
jgi:hypothetical protein